VYEALVGEVLSVEDAPTDQKDISKIATLAKPIVLSIEYIYEPNYKVTDIAYSIVAIIKKTCNYGNDQSAVNAYYQALASEIANVTGSNKRSSTLDCIWYNIKNL